VDSDSAVPPAIETRALTKYYGKVCGIEAVDLVVEQGEVFGFLGPNGAGKTTTIRTLLDFHRPTSGTATVLGLDSRVDYVEIHRRTGYLPGDLELYDRLTGRTLTNWLARLRGTEDLSERDSLAERFRLDLDRPIRDLSKGNRQKVGVVQAFMHMPELYVLDEPTGGLDPLMQEEFRILLREVVGRGATVFLSSHSLDEVERAADRVGVIRDGTMIIVDSVKALRARAKRHVVLRFTEAVDRADFANLPEVTDVTATDQELRMTVSGSLDAVVKAASRHTVVDFVSQPADLEEIFIDVYRASGGNV
jgi:ABC-2 type transport system ATP-binding protein